MPSLRSLAFRDVRFADRVASVLPAIGPFRPLRKPFSAHEALLAGDLEGRVLHERQDCGPCPPGSITERCGMRQHDHQPWPVFWVPQNEATLTGRIPLADVMGGLDRARELGASHHAEDRAYLRPERTAEGFAAIYRELRNRS